MGSRTEGVEDERGTAAVARAPDRCGRGRHGGGARRPAGGVLATAISAAAVAACLVKVSSTVREGNAAEVLIDAAEGADLLMVGSRGHGGFAEALLGSVSQHCVHHARWPVVIIPGLRAEPPSRELQDA